MTSQKLNFAKDIEQKLIQFSPTAIDFEESSISSTDRKVLLKLVQAANIIDSIFLNQVSSENQTLRQNLIDQKTQKAVVQYFDIMYGPWDRLDEDKPFVSKKNKPLGANFYPGDITKQEFNEWIKKNPKDKQTFRDNYTVIRREKNKLVAIPYSKEYEERLRQASDLLKDASNLTKHSALKKFLQLRADAFLSNDYYESDLAWMDLGDSPIEIVIGPYEVYEDRLMGYKAAFEAFITIPDPIYTARLEKLSQYTQKLESNLPLQKKYLTKRGSSSPIRVVNELYAAGDTRASIQTAAFNLPNDERVRMNKGSKKVMLKNISEAKFNKILIPIAKKMLDPSLLDKLTFEAYFTDILLHEIAHGLGPGQIVVNGNKTNVNQELKELYSAIEECKADIVGLFNASYLIEKEVLPSELNDQLPVAYLAGIFRAVRFGITESHAQAVLLGFNYLMKRGAITYDQKSEKFSLSAADFKRAIRDLAKELLIIQAHGSYDDAKKMLQKYAVVPPELKKALAKLKDVPVDILPRYTILEKHW